MDFIWYHFILFYFKELKKWNVILFYFVAFYFITFYQSKYNPNDKKESANGANEKINKYSSI